MNHPCYIRISGSWYARLGGAIETSELVHVKRTAEVPEFVEPLPERRGESGEALFVGIHAMEMQLAGVVP